MKKGKQAGDLDFDDTNLFIAKFVKKFTDKFILVRIGNSHKNEKLRKISNSSKSFNIRIGTEFKAKNIQFHDSLEGNVSNFSKYKLRRILN